MGRFFSQTFKWTPTSDCEFDTQLVAGLVNLRSGQRERFVLFLNLCINFHFFINTIQIMLITFVSSVHYPAPKIYRQEKYPTGKIYRRKYRPLEEGSRQTKTGSFTACFYKNNLLLNLFRPMQTLKSCCLVFLTAKTMPPKLCRVLK